MVTVAVAVVLLALTLLFLRQQKLQQRRISTQKDLPLEQLVPRHYQSFTKLENELWIATNEQQRAGTWDTQRLKLNPPQFQVVNHYLSGLREDFQCGHRIFGQVILHSPEMTLFTQLETERLRIEFAYYFWYAVVRCRLSTTGICIRELRRLTETVATLAQRVRTILNVLERSGNLEAIDSILKNS